LQLSQDSGFASIVHHYTNSTSYSHAAFGVADLGKWYWRVVAKDSSNNYSSSSSSRYFWVVDALAVINNNSVPIVDNDGVAASCVDWKLYIPSGSIVHSVNISYTITHPWWSDIVVWFGNNSAAYYLLNHPSGISAGQHTYTWSGESPFAGTSAYDVWCLKAQDTVWGDSGSIVTWTLTIYYYY